MPKTLKNMKTAQIPTHLSDPRKQEGREKVIRKHDRELLRIPIRLQLQDKTVSGFSQDFSPAGLRIVLQKSLKEGTPLALQCSFGDVCYLNISGQVVYCQSTGNGKQAIGIKFSALRQWEEKILRSAIQEVTQSTASQENSLVALSVAKDVLALEAAEWYEKTPILSTEKPRTVRQSCIHASKIIGWGSYLPPQEITNEDINALLRVEGKKTRFGEVVGTLTGIKSRRYAGSKVYPSDLAAKASRQALKQAGVDPKDIEVIIFCGVCRDVEEPATACILQEKIGADNAYVFDLGNACNGFVSAIDVLDSFIASGRCEVGLVACGEVGSQYVNWDPESKDDLRLSAMGYTLGDGGGAAVLSRVTKGEQRGIKARWFLSDSSYWRVAVIPLIDHSKRLFRSSGIEIEEAALEYVPIGVEQAMKMLAWDVDDLDFIIPHQVSAQIIENLFYRRLGVPTEKVFWSFPKHGNVGAASIPLALCSAVNEGRIRAGSKVLLVGGSGGFGVGIIGFLF